MCQRPKMLIDERRCALLRQALDHGVAVLHPESEIGLEIVGDLVQEHGLPGLVAVVRECGSAETDCGSPSSRLSVTPRRIVAGE